MRGVFRAVIAFILALPVPAAAVPVTFTFEGGDLLATGSRETVTFCNQDGFCDITETLPSATARMIASFAFDTRPDRRQLGDPPASTSYSNRGSGQFAFSGPSGTLQLIDPVLGGTFGDFPDAGNWRIRGDVGGEGLISVISGESFTEIDDLTGDFLHTELSRLLSVTFDQLPALVLINGNWLPAFDPMATNGSITESTFTTVYRRSAADFRLLSTLSVERLMSSGSARFLSGPTAVPEPATAGILGMGILLLAAGRRRARSRAATA